MLDGQLARIKGNSGKYGAFLDSTMDRFGDAAVFGGITIWFMRTNHLLAVVSLFCLAAGLSVSYVKARAEGLGLNANVGLIERPERLIIGLTSIGLSGLGIPYVLPIGMWGLAAGTALTLYQRMRAVYVDAKSQAAQPPPRPRHAAASTAGRPRHPAPAPPAPHHRTQHHRHPPHAPPAPTAPTRTDATSPPGHRAGRGTDRGRVMATLRERLSSAAFGAGWGLVCRLPESVARALFNFGADTAWRKQGGGVQVLEGNLLRIFRTDPGLLCPASSQTVRYVDEGKELRTLSREVMRSYARYYLETFRMQVIPAERIAAGMHVNFDQADLTLEYMKNGRGVIYALPHMGDFEQAGRWIIGYGAGSFTTVAERLEPEAVFQKWLDFRQGLGMEVLPTTGGPHPFGVMAQRLRAGKLVCLVADRDLSDTGVEVDFFGEKALFPAGPASLAVQTGAALMPVACWFEGEDEWGAHIYDEIPVPAEGTRKEKAAAMTQAMAAVFEGAIREHPEDWHMLQKVFVNDLDPERLARSRNRAVANGNGTPHRQRHATTPPPTAPQRARAATPHPSNAAVRRAAAPTPGPAAPPPATRFAGSQP